MELIQDPVLMQQIRDEVRCAFAVDGQTGKYKLYVHKLLTLPRLNSVYTEVLRMHISFNVTREVQKDIQIDGYNVPKGSLVQSASQIAHYNESVWATEKHPATEFWGNRHLEFVDQDEPAFSMKARPTSFFPFGTPRPVPPLPNRSPPYEAFPSPALHTPAGIIKTTDYSQVGDMPYAPADTLLSGRY
jgi:cytochrome P450